MESSESERDGGKGEKRAEIKRGRAMARGGKIKKGEDK